MILTIEVGEYLFAFTSERDWIETAQRLYNREKATMHDSVAITHDGRICTTGRDFRMAKERDAYPVMVYRTRPDVGASSTPNQGEQPPTGSNEDGEK